MAQYLIGNGKGSYRAKAACFEPWTKVLKDAERWDDRDAAMKVAIDRHHFAQLNGFVGVTEVLMEIVQGNKTVLKLDLRFKA